jgi:ribose-phosphate pyrophosphokinase
MSEGNNDGTRFITPDSRAEDPAHRTRTERGVLTIVSCTAGNALAAKVVDRYRKLSRDARCDVEVPFLRGVDSAFSDTEIVADLERHVGGHDVYLVQHLRNPLGTASVNDNYMAFFVAARALREHGARYVTAVLPYLAYSRQDKPTRARREPTTARLMADLCVSAGVDGIVSWHPHSRQVQGFYGATPIVLLEPYDHFVDHLRPFGRRDDAIVVAPDAGAAKMATHVARALQIDSAITSKVRSQAEKVESVEVIGDFRRKRTAIIVDDILSSGGTVQAVVNKLEEISEIRDIHVVVSHNLCLPGAAGMIGKLNAGSGLNDLTVTNSIPQTEEFNRLPFFRVHCLSDILARTINRIHHGRSVSSLFPALTG